MITRCVWDGVQVDDDGRCPVCAMHVAVEPERDRDDFKVCPVRTCGTWIPGSFVLCKPHWFRVSASVRRAVWDAFKVQPGSAQHLVLVARAIAEASAPAGRSA